MSLPAAQPPASSAARRALGLLVAINLLCYLDRYILASILKPIKDEFLAGDPAANSKVGSLASAFLISYMVTAPIFGWLADRYNRWVIIGLSVGFWSLASGASGLAMGFTALLATRVFLGVGEAGWGPAAPTIISDYYPVEKRGQVMAWFFMAIPVGSALGYGFGGLMQHLLTWRWAFYLMTLPGLALAAWCFVMPEPKRAHVAGVADKPKIADYARLLHIPSLITNILGQAAMTFAIGGLSFFVPLYLEEARQVPGAQASIGFGVIVAAGGLTATLFGGWLADRLRARFRGAYFLVSGSGMLIGFPMTIAMLYAPFPLAWVFVFLAVFFLFLNTGPANTALANVTPPALRATAFAVNILVIHALGDVLSPPLIGWIKDATHSWNAAFFAVSIAMLIAGVIWLTSMRALARDTAAVEEGERAGT
jgi:MFS family permease